MYALAHTHARTHTIHAHTHTHIKTKHGRTSAADFDYGTLRFKLGPAGAAALAELGDLQAHPDIEVIREGIGRAEAAKNYWEWQKYGGATRSIARLDVLPSGTEIPEALLELIRRDHYAAIGEPCRNTAFCLAFQAELDGAAPEEWVFMLADENWSRAFGFGEKNGAFEFLGRLTPVGAEPSPEDLEQALKTLQFRAIAPLHRDLEIGKTRYHLIPR
jgi:hypothetical protein